MNSDNKSVVGADDVKQTAPVEVVVPATPSETQKEWVAMYSWNPEWIAYREYLGKGKWGKFLKSTTVHWNKDKNNICLEDSVVGLKDISYNARFVYLRIYFSEQDRRKVEYILVNRGVENNKSVIVEVPVGYALYVLDSMYLLGFEVSKIYAQRG